MINQISTFSANNQSYNQYNIIMPVFRGKSVIPRYVKPIEEKHIPLLEKLSEFFAGTKEMFIRQQKDLATKSGSLQVKNIAEPIPEAKISFDEAKILTVRPRKFKSSDTPKIDLCHFEYFDSPKTTKFDIVIGDDSPLVKKGDIFSYGEHRADKSPIRYSEQESVNKIFNRYASDILNIIKKYQKKLS